MSRTPSEKHFVESIAFAKDVFAAELGKCLRLESSSEIVSMAEAFSVFAASSVEVRAFKQTSESEFGNSSQSALAEHLVTKLSLLPFCLSDMNNYHPKILIRRNNLLRKFSHRTQTK